MTCPPGAPTIEHMKNQYEIQGQFGKFSYVWETMVEFPTDKHASQEAMDKMIIILNMYRERYKDDPETKFRLVLITERIIA